MAGGIVSARLGGAMSRLFCFFFQAEDGIRDRNVTGVQTCALPISGHAESVEITFDPKQVSYGQLLQLFFSVAHDPTQLDRQGPDRGPSYRSEIFFGSPTQERVARAYVKQLTEAKVFAAPIVTKIEPLKAFYAAEDYHQDYLIHHPNQPYIVFNDLPKIEALKKTYPALYRGEPVALRGK